VAIAVVILLLILLSTMCSLQLLICGGANGNACLFDLFLLHTPTLAWSQVALGPHSAVGRSLGAGGGGGGGGGGDVSKRLCPGVLPVSPNEVIVFGGGTCQDFARPPSHDAIPADAYRIAILPAALPRDIESWL
jgi:hypothetical protein